MAHALHSNADGFLVGFAKAKLLHKLAILRLSSSLTSLQPPPPPPQPRTKNPEPRLSVLSGILSPSSCKLSWTCASWCWRRPCKWRLFALMVTNCFTSCFLAPFFREPSRRRGVQGVRSDPVHLTLSLRLARKAHVAQPIRSSRSLPNRGLEVNKQSSRPHQRTLSENQHMGSTTLGASVLNMA